MLGGVERDSIHARFALRAPATPDDVAVIGIDDKTLGTRGMRWPFRRSLHARAIDLLRAAGARAIVYDVQFTEPTTPRQDGALLNAIARAGNVILATTETDAHGGTNVMGGDDVLREAHARAAAANLVADPDGVFSRFTAKAGGLASLASAALDRVHGGSLAKPALASHGAWIDFRGPPGTIPTSSFVDLLEGRVDAASLRGRIVVVGATSPTLQDLHPTPVSAARLMSGPEIQANAIWTALHGVPLRDAPLWLALLAIAALGAVPALAATWLRPLAAGTVAVLAGAVYLALAAAIFDHGTILPVAAPLAALVAGIVAMVAARYSGERQERHRATARGDELELEIVLRLAHATESRDRDTGEHIDRMSRVCARLAVAVDFDDDEAERMRLASALHDIGKIAIPDAILGKPGPLDEDEWEVMKTHTTAGADLLAGSASPVLQLAETIAISHHERWDGSGYPAGLAGEAIPLPGRICAVADVLDALVSDRPYKTAWSFDDALAEMQREAGRHFEPRLVRALLELEPWLRTQYAAAETEIAAV